MAWLERRITRTSQPQGLVGIDWTNPLTVGLEGAGNSDSTINLVNNYFGTAQGAVPSTGTKGTARQYSSSGPPFNYDYHTQIGIGTNNRTLFVLCTQYSTSAAIYGVAGLQDITNSNSSGGYGIKPNGSNLWRFTQFDSGGLKSAIGTSIDLNRDYAITGVSDGSNIHLYQDGVNVASTSCGAMVPMSNAGFVVGAAINSGFDGRVYMWAVFNRALSDSEIKSLSDNPWQIFEPEIGYVWVDTALPPPTSSKGAWLEHRVTRTSQPQGLVGIDWTNPIAVGLLRAITPGGAGLSVQTTPTGVGLTPSQAVTITDASLPPLKTATLTSLSIRKSNTSQFRNNFAARITGYLGSNLGFGHGHLEYSSNRTLVSTYWTVGSVGGNLNSSASFLSAPAGDVACFTTTFIGGAVDGHALYYNGSLVATGSTTGVSGADSLAAGSVTFNDANGGSTQFDLPTAVVIVHDRVLTPAEIKSLSDNPWQIFEPEIEYVWVDALTAAGGDVVTGITGVSVTSSIGTLTAQAAAVAQFLGMQAVGVVGSVAGAASVNITLLGNSANSSLGILVAQGAATTTLQGVGSDGTVGTLSSQGGAITTVQGVATTSAIGLILANGASSSTGTVIGQAVNTAVGIISASSNVSTQLNGITVSSTVGNLAAIVSASTAIAGIQVNATVGNITANGNFPYTISLRYYTSEERNTTLTPAARNTVLEPATRTTELNSIVRNNVLNSPTRTAEFTSPRRDI